MQAGKDRLTASRPAGHPHLCRWTEKEAATGHLMRHPQKRTPKLPVSILERKACWTKLRTLTKPEETSLLPTAGECKGREVNPKGIPQVGLHSSKLAPSGSLSGQGNAVGEKKETTTRVES